MKMLLRRDDINPNKPDNDDRTPLMGAAWNGHEEVLPVLLGQGDVDPDKPDIHGLTPLIGDAWNGHEGVVQMLLGWGDVNPTSPIMMAKHRSLMLLRISTREW